MRPDPTAPDPIAPDPIAPDPIAPDMASGRRVALLSASISHRAGGLFGAVSGLALGLAGRSRYRVAVIGLGDDRTTTDLPGWQPLDPVVCEPVGPRSFGFTPRLLPSLLAVDADLLHQHGLWMYTSVAAGRWQRRTGRPRVVSCHGMLNAPALARSRWKKRLAGVLYESASLHRATCLHALGPAEARGLRQAGLTQPIAVIPNGVTPPTDPPAPRAFAPGAPRALLFLGRLCDDKGVFALIAAWQRLGRRSPAVLRDWRLVLAGWGLTADLRRLRAAARIASGPAAVIELAGPAYGAAKDRLLRQAAALVLPSRYEALPMAVLEAWAYRLPVLMTAACGLTEGVQRGAAWSLDAGSERLASGLADFLTLTDQERADMGARGHALVGERFTWDQVVAAHEAVYGWLLGGGPRPAPLDDA